MKDIKFWEESRDHWADSVARWIELGEPDKAYNSALCAVGAARMIAYCCGRIFDKF